MLHVKALKMGRLFWIIQVDLKFHQKFVKAKSLSKGSEGTFDTYKRR